MKPWIVYLSGPITGVPEAKENFARAERFLRSLVSRQGSIFVINPAARHPGGLTNAEYMKLSFSEIDIASDVCLLPGWENSDGASLEQYYAVYTGKPCFQLEDRFPEWNMRNGK